MAIAELVEMTGEEQKAMEDRTAEVIVGKQKFKLTELPLRELKSVENQARQFIRELEKTTAITDESGRPVMGSDGSPMVLPNVDVVNIGSLMPALLRQFGVRKDAIEEMTSSEIMPAARAILEMQWRTKEPDQATVKLEIPTEDLVGQGFEKEELFADRNALLSALVKWAESKRDNE